MSMQEATPVEATHRAYGPSQNAWQQRIHVSSSRAGQNNRQGPYRGWVEAAGAGSVAWRTAFCAASLGLKFSRPARDAEVQVPFRLCTGQAHQCMCPGGRATRRT